MREARLCDRHAQPLALRFEHKQDEKGLNVMKKVCYNDNCSDPLANGYLIGLPSEARERRGRK